MRLRALHENRSQDILRGLMSCHPGWAQGGRDGDIPFNKWAKSLHEASKICDMRTIRAFLTWLEDMIEGYSPAKAGRRASELIDDFSKAVQINQSFLRRFPMFLINALDDYGTMDQVMEDEIGDDENIAKYGIPDDGYKKWRKILTFPDGSAWFDLRTSECDDEATMMKHCGTASYDNETLLSYRTLGETFRFTDGSKWVLWHPHVTAVMNKKTRYLTQIKGRANRVPDPKYFPYIVKLLESNYVQGIDTINSPVEKGDFTLDLLDPKDRARLLKKKEGLANNLTPDEARRYFDDNTWGWTTSSDPKFYSGEADPHQLIDDEYNWNKRHFDTIVRHVNIHGVRNIRLKQDGDVGFEVATDILSDLIRNRKKAGEYSDIFFSHYIEPLLKKKARELIRSGVLPKPKRW